MAQIDTSIYANLLRPPKTMQEYDDEAQQRKVNALQAMSAQQAYDQQQRAIEEDRQFKNALAGGADSNALMTINPTKALAIQKSQQDIERDAAAMEHTKAQTQELTIKSNRTKLDQHMQLLGLVETPEDLVKWAMMGAEAGVPAMTAEKVQAFAANPPKDPAQLAELVRKIKLGGMTLQQQNDDFWKANGFAIQKQKAAETARHNRAQEGVAQQRVGVAQGNLAIRAAGGGGGGSSGATGGVSQKPSKPMPIGALKMQQESLDAISTAGGINADLGALSSLIDGGKLKLGPVNNAIGSVRNTLGLSDESSQNLATFKATLEKLRNDSLRLNKGVQTDGDSQRAWNELITNINDPAVVKKRLKEIQNINERAVAIHQMNLDTIRSNYGAGTMDTTQRSNQKPAIEGAAKKIASDAEYNALPSGATFIGPDGKTRRKP